MLTYEIVNVGRELNPRAVSDDAPWRTEDGRALAPGSYASVVTELPASQSADGRRLDRGFYAVFWPMSEHSPNYDARALYFGPFSSEHRANQFSRDVAAGF